MYHRLTRIVLVALAVTALAAPGIVANFILLGYAGSRNDRVGKLTPRADITQPASPTPAQTTEGEHHGDEVEIEEPDD